MAQDKDVFSERVFNAKSFELDNGLQVVLIPNHRAPVVTHMVWYRVGSADEDKGETGLAHFLEHLMFKGSPNVATGEFSKTVKSMGGHDNAFTSYDFTAYYQSVPVSALSAVMRMEADRMQGLLLPEEEILSERDVVLEERRQRTENDPRAYFGEQLSAMLFVNHPYGNPVIGWAHEVDILDREIIKKFYKKWYGPNNAILVVSGDVELDELKKLAEEHYGSIKPLDTIPPRDWTQVPPLMARPNLQMSHKDIKQPIYSRIYRVPSYRQNAEDAHALSVLEEVMNGGYSTRLYQNIVVKKKLASAASLSYYGTAWSDAKVYLTGYPLAGVDLEDIEKALDGEIIDVIDNGVTEKEVEEAKIRLMDSAAFARDSLRGPAMVVGQSMITGSSLEDIETWPQHVSKVTAAQIQDVAKKYLDPRNYGMSPYVTGYITPMAEEE